VAATQRVELLADVMAVQGLALLAQFTVEHGSYSGQETTGDAGLRYRHFIIRLKGARGIDAEHGRMQKKARAWRAKG